MTLIPSKEELKQHFEQNMLDGDDVYDCGKAMLSAESVFEYIAKYVPDLITKHEVEARIDELRNLPRIRQGITINDDTQDIVLENTINKRLSELQKGIEQ